MRQICGNPSQTARVIADISRYGQICISCGKNCTGYMCEHAFCLGSWSSIAHAKLFRSCTQSYMKTPCFPISPTSNQFWRARSWSQIFRFCYARRHGCSTGPDFHGPCCAVVGPSFCSKFLKNLRHKLFDISLPLSRTLQNKFDRSWFHFVMRLERFLSVSLERLWRVSFQMALYKFENYANNVMSAF